MSLQTRSGQLLDLPAFDVEGLISAIDLGAEGGLDDYHSPNTRGLYKPEQGEKLLADLLPLVKQATGRELFPCNSYGRVAYRDAQLREHTDRPGLDWTVSICLKRDAPWNIEVLEGEEWVAYDSEAKGILMNSGRLPHRRGPYSGVVCYQLFLHYTEELARQGDRPPPEVEYVKVPGVLTPEEIARIQAGVESLDFESGLVSYEGYPDDNRKSSISWLRRPDWQWLYDKLQAEMVAANRWNLDVAGETPDEVQFCRYTPGEQYGWHTDSAPDHGTTVSRRTLSSSTLLRNPASGGGFEMRKGGVVHLDPGDMIVFPSSEEHRALEVTEGTRESVVLWLCQT